MSPEYKPWRGLLIYTSEKSELSLKNNSTGSLWRIFLGTATFLNIALVVRFALNSALYNVNLRSDIWSGSHVLLFWDLKNEPRYGWVLIFSVVEPNLNSPIFEIYASYASLLEITTIAYSVNGFKYTGSLNTAFVSAEASVETTTSLAGIVTIDPGSERSEDGWPFTVGLICIVTGNGCSLVSFLAKNKPTSVKNTPFASVTRKDCAIGSKKQISFTKLNTSPTTSTVSLIKSPAAFATPPTADETPPIKSPWRTSPIPVAIPPATVLTAPRISIPPPPPDDDTLIVSVDVVLVPTMWRRRVDKTSSCLVVRVPVELKIAEAAQLAFFLLNSVISNKVNSISPVLKFVVPAVLVLEDGIKNAPWILPWPSVYNFVLPPVKGYSVAAL